MSHTDPRGRLHRIASVAASILMRGPAFGVLWAVLVGFRTEMLLSGTLVVPGLTIGQGRGVGQVGSVGS